MGHVGGWGGVVTITLIINFRESVHERVMMKIFPLMSGWVGGSGGGGLKVLLTTFL